MRKEIKQIIGGLCILVLVAGIVFFCLYRYMDAQTEKDVREIARVFLQEKAEQEENRFEAVKSIRFSQLDSMLEELETKADLRDVDSVRQTLAEVAAFQDLSNCSLISTSGNIDTIYGEPIERLGDEHFLMESLATREEIIVTGGWGASGQMNIFATALSLPMANGETSRGILWCKPMSSFASVMNLEDPDSLVNFYIIRRDLSYVVESESTPEEAYDDVVLKYIFPEGETAEEYLAELRSTIDSDAIFTRHSRYIDSEHGIDMRRSVYALPLQNTNWYLLCILPYGVLDHTITDMGQARSYGMFLALAVLILATFLVFGKYLAMMKRKLKQLEVSHAEADKARTEAEKAKEEAEKAKEDAELAREEAVVANKAKSEFLSNMSHDIRTPMNAVVGMTAIAKDHLDDRERVKDCLKKITLSGKQLLGLINDVLDMSKIESGKMTLNPEALSLKETMETMCDIVRPQIRANGQQFDIIISNILSEEVYCDSVRINQVLLNFLSNAMKFTPEGGAVFLELRQEESPEGEDYVRTHLCVRDTGMGMSEEFRKKLFTAFEREDNRRVHKTQGTGLGLTITKYIVEAMGGSIEVESEVGVGTTFHVIVDFERVKVRSEDMKLPDWRILVVDDNEELCRTAALSLTELGCRPDTCGSGEEAIRRAVEAEEKQEGYFALLIDYKMDGMSGVETAEKIREKVGDHLPISLISAYDWADIEEEAKEAGISGFIAKPLFKSTLYHELRRFLDGAAPEQEETEQESGIDLSGRKILLAEDNDINAEIAKMILSECGCSVDRAEDGKRACELFEASEEGYYDVILMDLRMPHRNGFEATETIRGMKRSDAAAIPIIAMTADAFAEDAKKCLAVGMNAHLAKPIDVDQLKQTLAKYMSRA